MDHGVVQRWLRQVLSPYAESDRVYSDMDQTLISTSSLSPKTEVYTYDDGRTQLLLTLSGTIPIQYRSATYNIPMAFWIPRSYPREAPMAYVTPTNDMLVRKGRFVDLSGRVEGEYMQRWQRKWEGCNLLGLIHDCQAIFGQEPPVYAKPKGGAVVERQSSIGSASRSISSPTGQPQQRQASLSSPSLDARQRAPPAPPQGPSSQTPSEAAPLRPPKPGQSPHFSASATTFAAGGSSRRTSNGFAPSSYHQTFYNAPSTSPTPSQTYAKLGANDTDGRYTTEPAALSPRAAQTSLGGSGPPLRHANHDPAHSSRTNPSNVGPMAVHRSFSVASTSSQDSSLPPPVPAPPTSTGRQATFPPFHASGHQHTFAGQHQPDAPPAPAPPRPPNPELLQMHAHLHAKLQARLHHIRTTTEESNAQLKLLGDDLDRGDLAIKDEMARLEAVRDVCRATGDEMQRAVDAGIARVAELRAKEEPDVDGLLSATSLVSNQLIDLVAEDNAIEDTLYHLGRALNAEIIDLDRFLKQTRFLAREQFMRRALALKICQGMGWEA